MGTSPPDEAILTDPLGSVGVVVRPRTE